MKTLWLHIGTPKTGTTSLQGFLHANQDALRDDGVNYVAASRSHIAHNLLAATSRRGDPTELFEAITAEVLESDLNTHIVSSELLFNIYTARRFLKAFPKELVEITKIVGYVRRQDIYLESLYKQLLKNNKIEPDRDIFLKDQLRKVDYNNTASAYSNVFGKDKILLRPFDRKRLHEEDVVADFAQMIGLEIKGTHTRPEGPANKSFSAEMSDLLWTLTTQTDWNIREVIRELSATDFDGIVKSRDVFSLAQRRFAMEKLKASNDALVADFMPDHGDFFEVGDLEGDEDANLLAESEARYGDLKAASKALLQALNSIAAKSEPAPEAEKEDAEEDDLSSPPTWYQEIFPGGETPGWYHKLGNHSLSFVDRGKDQLVVSYDNLSQAGNSDLKREPWAQKFCADRGYAHLSVYAQVPHWFRDMALIEFLDKLKGDGFFTRFKSVAMVGTSMGGFGALTFSSLSPGCNVVAFSPQSTLSSELVPWERRFAKGRSADWSMPYSDAAEQVGQAGKVYLIYDPFNAPDRAHMERLSGDNIIRLKAIAMGHKTALVLNRMQGLKSVMESGIDGTLDPLDFYQTIRGRKDLFLYRTTMEGYLRDQGREDRARQFSKAFKRRRRRVLNAT